VTSRLLLVLVAVTLLAGCGPEGGSLPPAASAATATTTAGTAPQVQLLEDFEDDPAWSLDSANDYAALSATEHPVTSGRFALRVAVSDNGRDKAIVRKEVDLDLSSAQSLLIDVYNAQSAAVSAALALHASDGSLWELKAQTLVPGWNRDLTFHLDASGFVAATDLGKWAAAAALIDRVLVYVLPLKGDCVVVLDNLRCCSTAAAVLRRDSARFLAPPAAPQTVARYAPAVVQIEAVFPPNASLSTTSLDDPWLRRMTAVQARVVAPDNTVAAIAGYCDGIESRDGQSVYHYRLQLPSTQSGSWSYQIGLVAGRGWHWLDPQSYVVDESVAGAGPVGIDAHDPRWLSRRDGSFFYPMGENVAWSGDYEPYAAAIEAAGGTVMRVWICPWNNPLDVAGKLAVVNFASASRIDAIFAIAARHNLTVQLCLEYHGALTWDWGRNPFSLANGGPCADPREFWSNGTARDHFHKLLDYCVARWGGSPQLFAWELFNESDLTYRFSDDDVISWHQDMAQYLHACDPLHHLVTTSVSAPSALPGLWSQAGLDLCEVHVYDPHAGQALQRAASLSAAVRQPVLVGEWGRGWNPADDQQDRSGTAYRQALWSGWMHGFAASPWTWWWDTAVEPNHLLTQLSRLARFVAGEDPRGETWSTLAIALPQGRQADCLIGVNRAYGYVYQPGAVDHPGAAALEPVLAAARHLVITGLAAGRWRCEFWDVSSGVALPARTITATSEAADLGSPGLSGEFAFKLTRLAPPVLGVHEE